MTKTPSQLEAMPQIAMQETLLKLRWCIKDVCDVLEFISNILEFFPSISEYLDCFLKFSDNYFNFHHFIKTFHCNIGCWPHCCDLRRNRSTMICNVSEHCRKIPYLFTILHYFKLSSKLSMFFLIIALCDRAFIFVILLTGTCQRSCDASKSHVLLILE